MLATGNIGSIDLDGLAIAYIADADIVMYQDAAKMPRKRQNSSTTTHPVLETREERHSLDPAGVETSYMIKIKKTGRKADTERIPRMHPTASHVSRSSTTAEEVARS